MTANPTNIAIATTVEQLVREIGHIPLADTDLNHHIELFDRGYLDSLGIVSLTAQIEQTFGVALTEEDYFDPRFTTIAGLAAIIGSRLSAPSPAS